MASPSLYCLAGLALAALVVLAAAAPSDANAVPDSPASIHHLSRRGFKSWFKKTEHKVAGSLSKAGHKVAGSLSKLENCLVKTPGLSKAALDIVKGCAKSVAGGVTGAALCAAQKGAIPAARATSHLVACMA